MVYWFKLQLPQHGAAHPAPLKTCKFCNGTGTRDYKGEDINCNVCNTESTRKEGIPIGKEKNWETNYSFDVDNVREFAEFCKESDGFEIC